MAMKDRMHTGALYLPGDDEIMDRQRLCLDRLYEFNHTRPTETDKRQALMKEMFAELGENCYIEPPFYSNFGGAHVHLGNHVYCNFAVTMVDDTHIYIGDNTMIAPNVTIATAGHPVLPELREYDYQYNMPVHIGRTCWIGAGAVILPGVTVGDNTVIGAWSAGTSRPTWWRWATPAGCCAPSVIGTKNTTSGITPLTMPKSLRIWRKTNKYKTNPAGSRNGRLRGNFLYISRCPAEICKIRSNPCGAGR